MHKYSPLSKTQIFLCALVTLQEHQWILTNATISKDSDLDFIMVAYIIFLLLFWKKLGNVCQNNTAEKYYILE